MELLAVSGAVRPL